MGATRTYYFTFGVQYAREAHRQDWVHPDGWLEVIVPATVEPYLDYMKARDEVVAKIDLSWAFQYTEEQFDPALHPLGALAKIEAGELTVRKRFVQRMVEVDPS